jgi:hypothetical protein
MMFGMIRLAAEPVGQPVDPWVESKVRVNPHHRRGAEPSAQLRVPDQPLQFAGQSLRIIGLD